MSDKRSEEKIECFEQWMKGDHVMVHLDSRKEGVCVPPSHEQNPSLALQLSYAFRSETTHDELEIRSFLKFHGEYFECIIPWSSIWGISSSDADSRIWPQDMPKELLVKLAQSKLQEVGKKVSQKFFGKEAKKLAKTTPTASSQHLKEVELEDVSSVAETNKESKPKSESKNSEKSPRRSPQLKRVK